MPTPSVRRDDKRLCIEGPIDVTTVPALMAETAGHLRDGVEIVDFAAVTDVDSAGVAFALACVREARAAGRTIAFANLPPAMVNLARLYAVADFIPVATA
jgi:phospholipid transport system transporter-binding protein